MKHTIKPKKAWKTILSGMKSQSGNHKWIMNKWYKIEGDINICNNGFHGSHFIQDAIRYVSPSYICEIEYKGDYIEEEDKFVASEMRIVKKHKWYKKDSVQLALFCVKRSIKYVDNIKFPEVFNVCINSIKAIEDYINNPCAKTILAAESAALSARSAARSAALSAAWSAAWSAALSAALSARSAAWSAALSARSAESGANLKEKKIIHKWIIKYLKQR